MKKCDKKCDKKPNKTPFLKVILALEWQGLQGGWIKSIFEQKSNNPCKNVPIKKTVLGHHTQHGKGNPFFTLNP